MQLPHSKATQNYKEQIRNVETNLKEATSGKKDDALLSMVQKRLDSLAEKYQYNEEIGVARYKLYELQAFVHYFNGHDDDAQDFIDQAIEMRGETYERAEKLKKRLSLGDSYLSKTVNPDKMTKEQRRERKVGLEGWLALFTVSIAITTITYIVAVFVNINNISNLSSYADGYASGVLSPYYSFLAFISAVMAGVGIWLLVLLVKWKKLGRWVGIAFAASSVIVAFIMYIWYDDILTKVTGLEPNSASGGTLVALIWIIYLCVSKRVKRTLIR